MERQHGSDTSCNNAAVLTRALRSGNLSVKSLADVVHKEDFADLGSEYLETLLVAVPK
jgi:hypothetical protein